MDDWAELRNALRVYAVWALTTVVDGAFLAVWIAVTWLVNNKVVAPLNLTGMDRYVLAAIQILFSASTLAPIAITIYRDITIAVLRSRRQIRHEMKRSDSYESD